MQESAEKVIKEKAERQAKRKAENEARKEKAAADKRAEESNKGQEKPPEVDVEAKPAEVKDT